MLIRLLYVKEQLLLAALQRLADEYALIGNIIRAIHYWNVFCGYHQHYQIFPLSSDKLAKICKLKSTGFNPDFMIDTTPSLSGVPLNELCEVTEEIVFAFNLQKHTFLYLNAAFEQVWTIPRDSVMSDLSILLNVIHPEDRLHVTDAFAAIQTDNQRQSIEFRIQPPGEQLKWMKLNATVYEKDNTRIIVGIAADITAERSYSDTLHKFNDRKNTILQILSHDLLGPLGSIDVAIQLLLENSLLKEDASVMNVLTVISKGSKRGITMIRDLVTAEFLQTADAAFVKLRVDLIQKVTVMIEQFQQSPQLIPQRFYFTTSSDSLFINIDESKFMQAINNLLSNALKFTPDDGDIEISITEPNDKVVLITVRDTGIGIPEDLQPFLFDKFTKARRTGLHGEPTNGLGMSIIKTIIEWHKGHIRFESTEGKGTTFYVEIPKDR